MTRRERRPQHRAWLVPAAVLDENHRGINTVSRYVFERHRPASGTAVPVTDLEQATHHIVVRDFAAAIFAARDRDRHRLRHRADPYFAMCGGRSLAGGDRNGELLEIGR